MGSKSDEGRRPFRFLFKLAVFAGILAAAGRFLVSKKEEYAGLTESEARERMETKLGARFGDEKAREITDQVIPVLADRGMFRAESPIAQEPAAASDGPADSEG